MGESAQAIADFDLETAVDFALEYARHLPRHAMPSLMYKTVCVRRFYHQLAFLTPGIFPSRAFILNGY